ncbi:helix-turn-helix transcriptional regulator [bacterium]|nr:helix-turn-helix transcriptional regulator [bacterium]
MNSKFFGQNLKKLRKSKGFTQQQLAEKAEMDEKHLSRIENGKFFPTHMTLNKILTALNVRFNEVGYNLELAKPNNNPIFEKALQILNTARDDNELNCYLDALKCIQKTINLKM